MEKKGLICFDMDGTIADLYSYPNWLDCLNNEDPAPYLHAKPLYNMDELNEVLNLLIAQGWEIRIISWLSKNSSEEFKEVVRAAKILWLNQYKFPYKKCHLISYGTTKANCVREEARPAILIDDNSNVRKGWHIGTTIDPITQNIVEELKKLLEKGN